MTTDERRFDKLIRDRVPDIIAAHGGHVETRTVSGDELRHALLTKLAEEHAEFTEAMDLAEMADMLEVMRALAAALGASWDDIEALREAKRAERGGFDAGVFLIRTTEGS